MHGRPGQQDEFERSSPVSNLVLSIQSICIREQTGLYHEGIGSYVYSTPLGMGPAQNERGPMMPTRDPKCMRAF